MQLELEAMPEPDEIVAATGRLHLTDDGVKTLCGRQISREFTRRNPDRDTYDACERCTAVNAGASRTRRLLG